MDKFNRDFVESLKNPKEKKKKQKKNQIKSINHKREKHNSSWDSKTSPFTRRQRQSNLEQHTFPSMVNVLQNRPSNSIVFPNCCHYYWHWPTVALVKVKELVILNSNLANRTELNHSIDEFVLCGSDATNSHLEQFEYKINSKIKRHFPKNPFMKMMNPYR